MSTLQRILVGHSLFPDGDIAVRSAAVLAERAHAALYLMHVVEPYPIYQKLRFPTVPAHALLEEVVLKARNQLNDLATTSLLSRFPVETDAHVGKPFVEIIKACRTWNANVIVVGVSPRGTDRFLGSTGERVLRKSPVPVWLVKRELLPGRLSGRGVVLDHPPWPMGSPGTEALTLPAFAASFGWQARIMNPPAAARAACGHKLTCST